MPQRLIFAILSAILFTAYNVSAKIAGENFHPLIGVIIINAVSVIVALILAFVLKLDFGSVFHSEKLRLLILGGVVTAFAEWSYFRMYSFDAGISVGGVVVTVLMIAIFSLLGYFVFKEEFTAYKFLGIFLAIIGVMLISLQ